MWTTNVRREPGRAGFTAGAALGRLSGRIGGAPPGGGAVADEGWTGFGPRDAD